MCLRLCVAAPRICIDGLWLARLWLDGLLMVCLLADWGIVAFVLEIASVVSEFGEFPLEGFFGMLFAVNEANFLRWFGDALDELNQVELIGVRGVSTEGVGFSSNRVFFLINSHRTLSFLAILNRPTGGTDSLVTDKDNIGIRAMEESS